jgi:hypothetical protein
MSEETINKLLKLVAESDSLVEIADKYITFMYWRGGALFLFCIAILALIVWLIKYEMR